MSESTDANALALRWHFQRDQSAREGITYALKGPIESLARNYHRRCQNNAEYDDLYQAGCIGCVKALDTYSPERGLFEPYAVKSIRGEMLHLIRDLSLLIKVPGSVKEATWTITRYTARFREERGRDPEIEEVAAGVSMSIDRVSHCISVGQRAKAPENIDDHVGEVANIYGERVTDGNLEPSQAQEIYRFAVMLRKQGANASDIGRELMIGRSKALMLLEHIDKELSQEVPDGK